VAVGRAVSMAASENLTPVILELGGKSPNIVLEDADLDQAIPTIVNSITQNAGQTCSAGSRLLVHEGMHDRVLEVLRERFEALTIGPGPDDPDVGPLISQEQLENVSRMVTLASRECRLVSGGGRPADPKLAGGFFFTPTIFDQVDPSNAIAQEEVFGPVLAVLTFQSLREAAEIANGTSYGLLAAVWTRDMANALWLAKEIRAGQIYVNAYGAGGGVELPFGGYKNSGHGREKGFDALLAYTQTKTVTLKIPGPPLR
jgi:aldehyde dehydrogenase (NAD+)